MSLSYKIKFYSNELINKLDKEKLFNIIKEAFDSSIPWNDPKYDPSVLYQYVNNAYSMVEIKDVEKDKSIALALSFNYKHLNSSIFYIAGIWVSNEYQNYKFGSKVIDELILSSCKLSNFDYIALRTHNPKVIKFFMNRYLKVYPFVQEKLPNKVVQIGDYIFNNLSPNKVFIAEKLIVRELYDKGFIVGTYHIIQDEIVNKIDNEISITNGDAYILIIPKKGDNNAKHS